MNAPINPFFFVSAVMLLLSCEKKKSLLTEKGGLDPQKYT